jgi:hypothetical protein
VEALQGRQRFAHLVGLGLGFLQANHIGAVFQYLQKVFLHDGAQAIHVPRNHAHEGVLTKTTEGKFN